MMNEKKKFKRIRIGSKKQIQESIKMSYHYLKIIFEKINIKIKNL